MITYLNKGRPNCTADPVITKTPDSMLRVTCSKCGLDYLVPGAVSA